MWVVLRHPQGAQRHAGMGDRSFAAFGRDAGLKTGAPKRGWRGAIPKACSDMRGLAAGVPLPYRAAMPV